MEDYSSDDDASYVPEEGMEGDDDLNPTHYVWEYFQLQLADDGEDGRVRFNKRKVLSVILLACVAVGVRLLRVYIVANYSPTTPERVPKSLTKYRGGIKKMMNNYDSLFYSCPIIKKGIYGNNMPKEVKPTPHLKQHRPHSSCNGMSQSCIHKLSDKELARELSGEKDFFYQNYHYKDSIYYIYISKQMLARELSDENLFKGIHRYSEICETLKDYARERYGATENIDWFLKSSVESEEDCKFKEFAYIRLLNERKQFSAAGRVCAILSIIYCGVGLHFFI